MIIQNTSKKVYALKAIGQPVLRLLPGYNNVDVDLEDYLKGNRAARGIKKQHLVIVKEKLSADEKREADLAKAKNAKLNIGRHVVKGAVSSTPTEPIDESEDVETEKVDTPEDEDKEFDIG